MLELSASEVNHFVNKQRAFKAVLWSVVALTIPGLSFTLWMTFGVSYEYIADPIGLGIFTAFLWVLGLLSWGLVLRLRLQLRKIREVESIREVLDTFKTARPLLRTWVGNYRNLSKNVETANFQVISCTGSSGEFQNSFSSGIDLFKFEIHKNGQILGSLRNSIAEFTDNTSVQAYVSSSETRGVITPTRSSDGHSKVSANTTNRVSTQQTGSAYVRMEGDEITPVVFAFANPSEALTLANSVNQLSANYSRNQSAKSSDLSAWKESAQTAKSELDSFLLETKVFRNLMCHFEQDLVIQECNRGTFWILGKMVESDYVGLLLD